MTMLLRLQLIARGPGRTGATAQRPAKTAQRRGIGRFFRKPCMVEVLALSMSRNMRCATWISFVQVSFIKQISPSLLQWIVLQVTTGAAGVSVLKPVAEDSGKGERRWYRSQICKLH